MSSDPATLEILEDAPLPGVAAIVAEAMHAGGDDAASVIQKRVQEQGVGIPGARANVIDEIMRIIARLRGRSLVSDLGVHTVDVDWLVVHVPQGGAARLKMSREETQAGSVDLKFMGLGLGAGRSIKVSAEQDCGRRERCLVIGSSLSVRIRAFSENGGSTPDSLQVDVEKADSCFLRSDEKCPVCFTTPAAAPALARPERTWDLTRDKGGLTETVSYDLQRTSEREVGLSVPIPGLPNLAPAISMSRTIASRCAVTYEFPGTASFTAYQMLGAGRDLPFWGRRDGGA